MISPAMNKLRDSLSCVTHSGACETNILINEPDSQATLKKVILEAPNGDWFSFDPDRGRGRGRDKLMSPLLAVGKEHDHHRACDCVVMVYREERLFILYIDLKSGNPKGCAGQFKSTRQFVRYALGLLEEFHDEKFQPIEERFIVFHGGKRAPINKQTTVPKREAIKQTQPDNAYKRQVFNSARIYLKELLA